MKTVAITGASSFTGLWITREFLDRGWKVFAQCSRPRAEYTGLRRFRVDLLHEWGVLNEAIQVEGFEAWIRGCKPSIWIHHHHFMEKFRAADYDTAKAEEVGLKPLEGIVRALVESGTKGVIYSGSFFEPEEGGAKRTTPPTAYAQSKKQVWDELSRLSSAQKILLSKVVIPNPIGPFENEDRVIPQLIERARSGQTMVLGSPLSISDQLPVTDLAREYGRLADELLQGRSSVSRPSGLVETVSDFVRRVNADLIEKRLGFTPCRVEEAVTPAVPTYFANPETDQQSVHWDQAWDFYSVWLKKFRGPEISGSGAKFLAPVRASTKDPRSAGKAKIR